MLAELALGSLAPRLQGHVTFSVIDTEDGFIDVEARAGSVLLGALLFGVSPEDDLPISQVATISVHGGYRRMGIATELYLRAARLSCERYGVPLGSGFRRSVAAEHFWVKQVSKRRAIRLKRRGRLVGYAFRCPPPGSLDAGGAGVVTSSRAR